MSISQSAAFVKTKFPSFCKPARRAIGERPPSGEKAQAKRQKTGSAKEKKAALSTEFAQSDGFAGKFLLTKPENAIR